MADDDNKKVTIDEKEAKKQFFEELKNKNSEEKKNFEETNEEEVSKEEVSKQDDKSEVSKPDDFSKSVNKTLEQKKSPIFNRRLKGSIIDTIVTGVVSIALVYIIDIILRLISGYYIVDMKGMFIIVFIIVLVLYPFIMSKTKLGCTVGEKLSN